MNDLERRLDQLLRRVAAIESEQARARLRLGSIESFVEANFEPPARVVEVRDAKECARSTELGIALGEARAAVRGVKDSVRGLRRAVSPEDDTGAHQLPPKDGGK